MRCPDGHDVPDGALFCPTCGRGTVPATPMCANGHPVSAEDRFCTTCGTATGTPTGYMPPPLGTPDVSAGGPPLATDAASTRRSHRRGPVLAAILGVTAIVIAVAVGLSGRGSPDQSPGGQHQSVETAVPADTPHETCTMQVYAVAAHMIDVQDGDLQEVYVNGVSDPFLQAGREVRAGFGRDLVAVGAEAARTNALFAAADLCAETLNDQVRANYPTDGTYPGQ